MVDFWVAPPKNHILNENGDVLEVRESFRDNKYITLLVSVEPPQETLDLKATQS